MASDGSSDGDEEEQMLIPPPGLADLDDALLVQVARHLPLLDLCRAQLTCRRLHGVIAGEQGVWRALYEATWPEGGAQQQQPQQPTPQQQQQAQQQAPQQQQQAQPPPQQAQQQQQQQQQQRGRPPGPSAAAAGTPGASSSSSRPPDAAGPSLTALPQPTRGSKRRRESAAAGAAAAAGVAAGAPAAAVDWRARFQARYAEEARRERAKRQVRRMKAEDAVLSLRRQVHQLEQALAREQRGLPALREHLAGAARARAAAAAQRLAQRYWLPVAVQQAHGAGVVTDQEPQDAEAHEQDLRQRLAVSELEVRKLSAALEARRRRLGDAQRKLQALLP